MSHERIPVQTLHREAYYFVATDYPGIGTPGFPHRHESLESAVKLRDSIVNEKPDPVREGWRGWHAEIRLILVETTEVVIVPRNEDTP